MKLARIALKNQWNQELSLTRLSEMWHESKGIADYCRQMTLDQAQGELHDTWDLAHDSEMADPYAIAHCPASPEFTLLDYLDHYASKTRLGSFVYQIVAFFTFEPDDYSGCYYG